jgi:hypothetical protein
VQDLNSQAGAVDAAAFQNLFPDLAGTINALLVTGDYYDVNFIAQTNVMANANVVSLTTGHSGQPKGAALTVLTGKDQAVDSATIVDAGSSASPYLNGHYYQDTILIQTNIIGDGGKITGHDPNQLAPELIAFTGTSEEVPSSPPPAIVTTADVHHHSDVL